MNQETTLYHGSPTVVQHPSLDKGKIYNDYGQGFYCTPSLELACEWACKSKTNGFANRYILRTKKLKTLDLLDGSFTALHWIALLLANREFTLQGDLAQETRSVILDRFLIDTSSFDLIVGYRADDAYFAFAEAFVEGALSLEGLEQALYLGRLGEQVALVSHAAFQSLHFEEAVPVDASFYYPKFIARDIAARDTYRNTIAKRPKAAQSLFALDILRMSKEEADARIQRISR